MSTIELKTEEELGALLQNNEWVLLDFWASWCGPCKMMGPTFERVSEQKSDQLKAVKVNVDHLSNIAAKFKIRGIPTLVLLRNGEIVDQRTGGQSEKDLNIWIDNITHTHA